MSFQKEAFFSWNFLHFDAQKRRSKLIRTNVIIGRTVVLLHCATLGFLPLEIAAMFMLYEFMGIVVNLFGVGVSIAVGRRGRG